MYALRYGACINAFFVGNRFQPKYIIAASRGIHCVRLHTLGLMIVITDDCVNVLYKCNDQLLFTMEMFFTCIQASSLVSLISTEE